MLPFSREAFFEVFAHYNAAIWPAPLLVYPLALLASLWALQGTLRSGRLVAVSLAVMWAWVGLVYHGMFFTPINAAARIFAEAFILQSLLFGLCAVFGKGLDYRRRSQASLIAGAVLILYATVAYPLIGFAAGERYPAIPLFGVTPCPLLIFTFGLMLWASRVSWWLWILPLSWSVIGGSASFLLSVPQDLALPISAVAAVLIASLDRRKSVLTASR
jgi:hypothetical protein